MVQRVKGGKNLAIVRLSTRFIDRNVKCLWQERERESGTPNRKVGKLHY